MEKVRPEPAQVLHVCKNQVAELELWLHQANVAFEPETLDADMQQVVEQQLVGCQVRLLGLSSWPVSLPVNSLVLPVAPTPMFILALTFCSQDNSLK